VRRLSITTRESDEPAPSVRLASRRLARSCLRTANDARRLLREIEMTLDLAPVRREAAAGLATRLPESSPSRNGTTTGTRALEDSAEPQTLTLEPSTARYGDSPAATPGEIAFVERAGTHLLQQIWGLDDYEARDVLQAADMRIDVAINAWLDSGEYVVRNRRVGDAPPPDTRLAMTLRISRQVRLAVALRFAHERTLEMTRIHSCGPDNSRPPDCVTLDP